MQTLIQHYHDQSRYGTRRPSAALKARHHVGRHKTHSLMRKHAMRACWKRKFVHTTDSGYNLPVAENLLNRNLCPKAPNQA